MLVGAFPKETTFIGCERDFVAKKKIYEHDNSSQGASKLREVHNIVIVSTANDTTQVSPSGSNTTRTQVLA